MTLAADRIETRCDGCGLTATVRAARATGWRCSDCKPRGPIPDARNVDWPSLVALAEARGVPVLRADDRGELHIIRTSRQLRDEWETTT